MAQRYRNTFLPADNHFLAMHVELTCLQPAAKAGQDSSGENRPASARMTFSEKEYPVDGGVSCGRSISSKNAPNSPTAMAEGDEVK
jgi:hypothetical protein